MAAPARRTFRPALVAAVRGMWLAVDEIQPVAVSLARTGDVVDVISWNDLPPPQAVGWPTRELITDGSTAWVRDQPDGPVVRIDAATTGSLTVQPVSAVPDLVGAARSHARFGLNRDLAGDEVSWSFRSRLVDFRWEAQVVRTTVAAERSWSLGAGGISSCAAAGTAAAACVSRATKRPWTFRPDRDLFLVAVQGDPVVALPHDALDITARCWPRPSPGRIQEALAEYLPFTLAESRSAMAAGASDVQIRLSGLADLPAVETSFRWGEPDRRYVRVDQPVDELGRSFGLRFLNIALAEDIAGGGPF